MDLLRPIARDALANPHLVTSADSWQATHDLAALLRSRYLAPNAHGAAPREYALARPDLAHEWRLANAEAIDAREWTEHPDGTDVIYKAHNGAKITFAVITQHTDEWHPDLHTAAEVIANAKQWNRR